MIESAVVVGGGLSGLAAAHRLREAGVAVSVLERADRPGGMARSERHQGYLVDVGCDLLNTTFERYIGLAEEVGLPIVPSSRVVDFIRDGGASSVDTSSRIALARADVLSVRGKLAFARGWLRLRSRVAAVDPYALTASAADEDHGTARDLCLKYFDEEVSDYVIDPILRAFAGTGTRHASGLSVLGALAVGTAPLAAAVGGMSALPEALGRRTNLICDARVVNVEDADYGVTVGYEDREGSKELRADVCVLAIPYHEALGIWAELADAEPDFGRRLEHLPLINISLGYDVEARTRAYAVMVPTVESEDALLVLMQQNKAPDRVPRGKTLATVFTEALSTHRFLARTDDEIVAWAATELERIYPELRGHRDLGIVTRWPHTGYWPKPGYWQDVAALRAALPRRRIHVTSTLFGSGGVERAVLGGERTAARILKERMT